ncbi:hypothetical protein HHI36_004159 [Cryptolaemus montrouzieri]|uniref:STX17-like N-terminal domain-containing protein n=1 Tax=Cryptolaemus montrouzieri TaxID=559131 RepID=A0ABD2NR58_9CUCU
MSQSSSTGEKVDIIISPFHMKLQNCIPRHQEIFENYKLKLNKLITQGYVHELQRDTTEKMEKIKELEALKQELNVLRGKIAKSDLHIFDRKIERHRISLNELLQGYSEHMDIVNDILVTKRLSEKDTKRLEVGENSSSKDRFPRTLNEFEKYKNEFIKYDALHDYVDDNFLYDVMKDIALTKKGMAQPLEIKENEKNQEGSSNYVNVSESSGSEIKNENTMLVTQNANEDGLNS